MHAFLLKKLIFSGLPNMRLLHPTRCYMPRWCRITVEFKESLDSDSDLTLMMTSAQVVETSVTTTDNSPSQDYTHPDDQTTLLHVTPGFKPFTVLPAQFCCRNVSHHYRQQSFSGLHLPGRSNYYMSR